MSEPATTPVSFWDHLLAPGLRLPLILLLCAVIYLPMLANGFTMDDASFVSRHPWRSQSAWMSHLQSLALHLGAVGLCYAMLRRLRLSAGAAATGALVFGLHALHSEAVLCITSSVELLGFILGSSACLLFSRMIETQGSIRILAGLCASLLFFLAFRSTETSLGWVPFLLVWLHARRMQRTPAAGMLPRADVWQWFYAAVLIVPLLILLWLHHLVVRIGMDFGDPNIQYLRNSLYYELGFERYATAFLVQGHALLQSLFPFWLASDYSHSVFPIIRSIADPWFWLSTIAALALAAMLVTGLRWHRRRPVLFAAAGLYLCFALLQGNFLGRTDRIYSESTWYTPILALSLLVGWIYDRVAAMPGALPHRSLAQITLGLWLGISCLVVLQRTPLWKDDATLFLHETQSQPGSARLAAKAAAVHLARGEQVSAGLALERAAQLDPACAGIWVMLGRTYLELGRPAEARDALKRAYQARHPGIHPILERLTANLALAYLRLHQYPQAIDCYSTALGPTDYFRSRKDLDAAILDFIQDDSAPLELRIRAATLRGNFLPAQTPPR